MAAIAVPIQRIDKTLDMPAYAYPGDAGLDLRAAEAAVLKPFERKLVSCGIKMAICGIKMAIPRGYAGFVMPRSGLAVKHGISIVNSPGLIDSDYRGEIKAILVNLDPENDFIIEHGDRIAQIVILETPTVTLEEVDELSSTERGTGGFGSSGMGL